MLNGQYLDRRCRRDSWAEGKEGGDEAGCASDIKETDIQNEGKGESHKANVD